MIFVGDIASPSLLHSAHLKKVFEENSKIFTSQTLVANLEGLITNEQYQKVNIPILYNHSSVLDSFESAENKVFCLANNHTLDLPESFKQTKKECLQRNIAIAGAGYTKQEAEKPVIFDDNGKKAIVFNACWDFLLYNHKNPSKGVYIAQINELRLIKEVRQYRKKYPEALIIFYFHWSLDHEILPYPMYRQFSRKLIDEGAHVIVGAHAHCVQGGEKYKNGYIVYGLGNFFLPQNVYAGGKLNFPESSNTELAFEWNPENNDAICHWFNYRKDGCKHTLEHIKSESFEQSELLQKFTPYANMPHEEYTQYFIQNRRKKFLIPVYRDYRNTVKNKLDTFLLKRRAHFARFLAKRRIIKWQK